MTPKTGKSLIALLGVTGLLGVGMLATDMFVDEAPASGAADTVSAALVPETSSARTTSTTRSAADSTRRCTRLSTTQISEVTGGRVDAVSDPDAPTGDVCRWEITGSAQVPDGTRLSLSEDAAVTAASFAAHLASEVKLHGAHRLTGVGSAALLTGDGDLEVRSGHTSYRIGFTVEDGQVTPGRLRSMEIALAHLLAPA